MTPGDGGAVYPDVAGAVERLNAASVFATLLSDDREQRAAALETALARLVDPDTRIAWVGNPLRSPLTMERFLIQIVGPEVDLRVERGPQELAAIIAKPVASEKRLLIVVQQPETIDAPTRDRLVAMERYLRDAPIRTQFLFAGSTAFTVPAIPSPDPVRSAPTTSALAVASAPPLAVASAPPLAVASAPPPVRSLRIPATLGLLLLLAAGLWFSIAPARRDEPPPAPPSVPAAPAPAPPRATPEVTDQTALLRREFDAFLAGRAASLPPLSDQEKDALFLEFLSHHNRE